MTLRLPYYQAAEQRIYQDDLVVKNTFIEIESEVSSEDASPASPMRHRNSLSAPPSPSRRGSKTAQASDDGEEDDPFRISESLLRVCNSPSRRQVSCASYWKPLGSPRKVPSGSPSISGREARSTQCGSSTDGSEPRSISSGAAAAAAAAMPQGVAPAPGTFERLEELRARGGSLLRAMPRETQSMFTPLARNSVLSTRPPGPTPSMLRLTSSTAFTPAGLPPPPQGPPPTLLPPSNIAQPPFAPPDLSASGYVGRNTWQHDYIFQPAPSRWLRDSTSQSASQWGCDWHGQATVQQCFNEAMVQRVEVQRPVMHGAKWEAPGQCRTLHSAAQYAQPLPNSVRRAQQNQRRRDARPAKAGRKKTDDEIQRPVKPGLYYTSH